MAKDKKKKEVFEDVLPQNILFVGDKVEENKNIYIYQPVYKEIHDFTKNKTKNESGGILVGNIIEEFGKTNIIIRGFVEAKHTESTPTTLTFTHETWEYVHSEIEKKYENGKIVGWIHTHPDFGIFLSEYDTFIQQNFFKEDYQVAYVVDPIQHIEGFYFWINEKIIKCKGFYIFDETDQIIEIESFKEDKDKTLKKEETKTAERKPIPVLIYGLLGGLIVLVLVLVVIGINMMNRMKILETQQDNLVESANQSITYMQQQISSLEVDVEDLQLQIESLNTRMDSFENTVSDATLTDATPTDGSKDTNNEAGENESDE